MSPLRAKASSFRDWHLIVNEEIPRSLRRAMVKQAKARNVSLNDIAGQALAEHFSVEWELSGLSYRPTVARFRLRVPDELHRLLRMEAANQLGTIRGVALALLAAHFGTPMKSVGRRPKGGKR